MPNSKDESATITITVGKATVLGFAVVVGGAVLQQGFGAVVGQDRAQTTAVEAAASSASKIQETVSSQKAVIDEINNEVGHIHDSVDKVDRSLENFKGWVEASLANMQRELQERADKNDERIRLELIERIDDLKKRMD